MKIQITVNIGDPTITPTQAQYLAADICFKAEATLDQTKFRNEYEVYHVISEFDPEIKKD